MEESRRGKRWMLRLIPLGILIVAVITVALVFRVKTVVVSGNTRHTAEEVTASLLDGQLEHNTLYLMWKYRSGEPTESFPYANSVKTKMNGPRGITVTVDEKEPIAYLEQSSRIYFDKDGTVLEISDQTYDKIPLVVGLEAGEPVLYQKLPATSSAQLRTVLNLVQLLNYNKLEASQIRFDSHSEINIRVNSVNVQLGRDEYLEEKVANLKAILDTMDDNYGTLHMESFTGKGESVTWSGSDGEEETETPVAEGSQAEGGAEGTEDAEAQQAEGTGEEGSWQEDGSGEDGYQEGEDTWNEPEEQQEQPPEDDGGYTSFMVFNSNGELIYNATVSQGMVVDAYGSQISGCYVNDDGHVVDAYMNEIDPYTGEVLNLQ